jgi:hypothetical protein
MAETTLISTARHASPVPAARAAPNFRAILALDLGTTTGWAIRGYDGLITSGTV